MFFSSHSYFEMTPVSVLAGVRVQDGVIKKLLWRGRLSAEVLSATMAALPTSALWCLPLCSPFATFLHSADTHQITTSIVSKVVIWWSVRHGDSKTHCYCTPTRVHLLPEKRTDKRAEGSIWTFLRAARRHAMFSIAEAVIMQRWTLIYWYVTRFRRL